MSKIISKGRKTWKDGSVMTYMVTDDGVLTLSGSLRDGCLVPFKSKAPFRQLVIADGIGYVGKENFKGLEQLEERRAEARKLAGKPFDKDMDKLLKQLAADMAGLESTNKQGEGNGR